MRFQFYLEKLHNSEEFNSFIKENPKAYLCSCFFILDKENREAPDNKQHFDYYVPESKETFSFKIEE